MISNSRQQALHTVQSCARDLIVQSTNLVLIREWHELLQCTDLLKWIGFLNKLDAEIRSPSPTPAKAAVPSEMVRTLAETVRCPVAWFKEFDNADSATVNARLSVLVERNQLTHVAVSIVYLVRVLERSVILTGECELIAHDQLMQRFGVPVVHVESSVTQSTVIALPAKPSLVIVYADDDDLTVEPTSRAASPSLSQTSEQAVAAPASPASPASPAHAVRVSKILPHMLSPTSRRYYDRVIHVLAEHKGRWFSKGDVLRQVTQDSRELDAMRSTMWLWNKRVTWNTTVTQDTIPGLLMKQEENGMWYFRFNPPAVHFAV